MYLVGLGPAWSGISPFLAQSSLAPSSWPTYEPLWIPTQTNSTHLNLPNHQPFLIGFLVSNRASWSNYPLAKWYRQGSSSKYTHRYPNLPCSTPHLGFRLIQICPFFSTSIYILYTYKLSSMDPDESLPPSIQQGRHLRPLHIILHHRARQLPRGVADGRRYPQGLQQQLLAFAARAGAQQPARRGLFRWVPVIVKLVEISGFKRSYMVAGYINDICLYLYVCMYVYIHISIVI